MHSLSNSKKIIILSITRTIYVFFPPKKNTVISFCSVQMFSFENNFVLQEKKNQTARNSNMQFDFISILVWNCSISSNHAHLSVCLKFEKVITPLVVSGFMHWSAKSNPIRLAQEAVSSFQCFRHADLMTSTWKVLNFLKLWYKSNCMVLFPDCISVAQKFQLYFPFFHFGVSWSTLKLLRLMHCKNS